MEIGAVVVWRVNDAAKASFNVDDYKEFVGNQSESAVRAIAARYPYDSDKETSLRGNAEEITNKLLEELNHKLSTSGIIIEDVKLSHLAYASEIATSMLRKQQAEAVLQARKYLVENALTIVDNVLVHFEKDNKLNIDPGKKLEIINNLLVILTSDKEANPVINVGS
ncbi:MAG: hypothetical protein K1X44_06495 [Alphaproteobacteria bacterium]|nr:hypothetical protein [Alphaproteobacteria bacterium]